MPLSWGISPIYVCSCEPYLLFPYAPMPMGAGCCGRGRDPDLPLDSCLFSCGFYLKWSGGHLEKTFYLGEVCCGINVRARVLNVFLRNFREVKNG